jgi:hypothetical protein
MSAKRLLAYHYYSSPECNFLALLWRERIKVRVANPRALTPSLILALLQIFTEEIMFM